MIALAAALLVAAVAPAPAPRVTRRALIVANNSSDQPGVADLRYADDDGVHDAEVLARLGIEVTLLTTPDAETAQENRPPLSAARPPNSTELDAAVARIAGANAADRAQGRRVEVLFFYVGHGAVDDAGRAYLTLVGGRLDREALQARVIDRLGADLTHVIVDACRAAGVVGHRGGDPAVLAQVNAVLDQEQLARRPDVGVIYAESEDGRTNEWSRLRGGVFSHLVRSALMGAADINGDGQIEYSELQAFVAASLLGVHDSRTRLMVHASAPSSAPRSPLVTVPPPGPELDVPAGFAETRLTVADETGIPLADLHRSPQSRVRLALPERSAYWLRTPNGEARLGAQPQDLPLPPLQPIEISMRGPEEDSLKQGLFAVSFDRSFYEGFVASAGLASVDFAAAPSVSTEPVTSPAASRPLGLEIAVVGGEAPLGSRTAEGGLAVAWRSAATEAGWRFGVEGSWRYAPGAWSGGAAAVHRFSAIGLAGWEGPMSWAPFAEVGAGYLGLLALTTPTSGDLFAGTGRLAVGVAPKLGSERLRLEAMLDADLTQVSGSTGVNLLPGLQLGIEF